jgi:hypothetical protein
LLGWSNIGGETQGENAPQHEFSAYEAMLTECSLKQVAKSTWRAATLRLDVLQLVGFGLTTQRVTILPDRLFAEAPAAVAATKETKLRPP